MDNKPKWYEQAGSGPFEKGGFTAEHAENVIRTIREGRHPAVQERAGRPYRAVAAACIVLTVAGLGWTAAHGPLSGYRAASNASPAASEATSEAAMRNTADKAMREMLDMSFPLESIDYLPDKKQTRYSYRSGSNTVYVWISTETGAMVRAKVQSTLKPGEVREDILRKAKAELANLGYKGIFYYRASRYVNYDASRDKTMAIQTTLHAKDARVEFINGDIDRISCEADSGSVDPKAAEAGVKALKAMNATTDNPALTGTYRYIKGGTDWLTLNYADNRYVSLDFKTHRVYQVTDHTLYPGKSDSASARVEEDRQLLAVDEKKLRAAAESLASAYGVRLKGYQLTKNPKTPGIVTFTKKGRPDVTISYNPSGAIWRIELEIRA